MRGQGGSEHGGVPWFSSREGSSRAGWRKPVGCVELAMTHRSAFRCVFATHFLLVPGKRGLPPTFPWHLFSRARPTPFAAGRKLASFSCLIPPSFVLSYNMPRINTTSKWPGRPGGSPTQAPTDPDVQNSSIRFLIS